jgi:hypothetical protein
MATLRSVVTATNMPLFTRGFVKFIFLTTLSHCSRSNIFHLPANLEHVYFVMDPSTNDPKALGFCYGLTGLSMIKFWTRVLHSKSRQRLLLKFSVNHKRRNMIFTTFISNSQVVAWKETNVVCWEPRQIFASQEMEHCQYHLQYM